MTEKTDNEFRKNAYLAVGAVILVTILIGLGFLQSARYERDAADRSYAYARNAESEMAGRCRPNAWLDPTKCVAETKNAARKNQRAEQDLAAQKVTAWWTSLMGAAAIFGAILSAVGVFLVWRTFRVSNEGNEISRQSMTTQNRAWIEIEILSLGDLIYADGEFRLTVSFKLKNIGETVALNAEPEVLLIMDPVVGQRTIGTIEGPLLALRNRLNERPSGVFSQNIFPGQEGTLHNWGTAIKADEVQVNRGGGSNLYMIGLALGVRYHTIFDDPNGPGHQTLEVAHIRRLDEEGRASLAIVGRSTIPSDKIRLVTTAENFGLVT